MYVSPIREPLIKGNKTYSQITKDIAAPIEGKPGKAWYMGLTISKAKKCIEILRNKLNI